ncbi:hypothetical protein OROMI_000641 [Orobanche minor]
MTNSIEVQTQKNTPKTLNPARGFLRTGIHSNPRFSLFITLLLTPFLVICITRLYFPARLATSDGATLPEECPSGKVYAYDLPSKFYDDLLPRDCTDDLNPWKWQCGAVSNHGYGGPAVELRRILPGNLWRSWYRTNQFALESIFHERVLKHKCRTLEPESAAAFYIPFYAGLAVGKYLSTNDTSKRDHRCKEMLQWIKEHKYWKASNGSDHFMTVGRITWDFRRLTDPEHIWGSTFLNMPEMQNVTRFIIEKDPWDAHDVSVPYPTGFHPQTKGTLNHWQEFARGYSRSSLFTFVGATRSRFKHDFRGLLHSYCRNETGSCRLIDCAAAQCSTDSSVVLKAFLGSDFCLQPMGDSVTRRSVFDCMVAGSVPVFFWNLTAYEQYQWFLPAEPKSYSVFIDHEVVRSGSGIIKQVLMGFSKEEIRRKREKVIETIPRIIYGIGDGGSIRDFKDAFDIAFDGVLERIKEDKE